MNHAKFRTFKACWKDLYFTRYRLTKAENLRQFA